MPHNYAAIQDEREEAMRDTYIALEYAAIRREQAQRQSADLVPCADNAHIVDSARETAIS